MRGRINDRSEASELIGLSADITQVNIFDDHCRVTVYNHDGSFKIKGVIQFCKIDITDATNREMIFTLMRW